MELTFTYRDPLELTELADGTPFPTSISMRVIRMGLVPLIDLTLEVRDGRPVLASFAFLRRTPTGPPLTATEIHDTNVSEIVESAIRSVASTATLRSEELLAGPPSEVGDVVAGDRAADLARGRRGPSERQLRLTAKIWQENNDYNPRKQVAQTLYVSERTASRWIATAKERGYITEED